MKEKIKDYLTEVKLEMEKVSWPKKEILKITTLVVIVFMLIIALYIGIVDIIFSKIISLFLR